MLPTLFLPYTMPAFDVADIAIGNEYKLQLFVKILIASTSFSLTSIPILIRASLPSQMLSAAPTRSKLSGYVFKKPIYSHLNRTSRTPDMVCSPMHDLQCN